MKQQSGLSLLVALALLLSACGTAATPTPATITGVVWQWTAMQETVPAGQSVVPNPENYTITFNTDNTVNIKADCNQVGGTYTTSGSSLTITPGPSTMAFCGEASQDTIYLASLSKVNSYAMDSGALQLKFANDGGKMDFKNGGTAK